MRRLKNKKKEICKLAKHIQGDNSPNNVKFHDISPTVPGTPAHAKCYSHHAGIIVSGGGRNATETKMKCTNSAKSRMVANMQLTINSFRPLFSDKIFSLTLP